MHKLKWLAVALAVSLIVTVPVTAQKQEDAVNHIAIRAGLLIDGFGGPPIPDAVILVENDIIKSVRQNTAIPACAETIDLSRSTVLPGLIDCHTHITMQLPWI